MNKQKLERLLSSLPKEMRITQVPMKYLSEELFIENDEVFLATLLSKTEDKVIPWQIEEEEEEDDENEERTGAFRERTIYSADLNLVERRLTIRIVFWEEVWKPTFDFPDFYHVFVNDRSKLLFDGTKVGDIVGKIISEIHTEKNEREDTIARYEWIRKKIAEETGDANAVSDNGNRE
ncbi:MAG: hypothetical protein IJU03_09205 [Thermoguttaceae bacterium]|nr:hypothetical protein [Thermoguttaceae bacterium]